MNQSETADKGEREGSLKDCEGDRTPGGGLRDTIYRTIAKSFRIKSIETVDSEFLYDDITAIGDGVEDDDVFLDKDKELSYVADHFAMKGRGETPQGEPLAVPPEHVYTDILDEEHADVQTLFDTDSKLRGEAKKEAWARTRPRRTSDVIDCLGEDCINLRRSSDSSGIAIASPRSRASSDLGYSGSYTSSPAGTAFSFPPASTFCLPKRLNDVTDSKPFNDYQMGVDYVVPEAQMPVERDAEEYNMFHPRRGRAVIFNNDAFDNNLATPRKGSEKDVANLEETFHDLGFTVTRHDNLTFHEIKKIVQELREEDHSDADCLIVAVLTHGMDNGLLYARDALYPVESLWYPFTADNCLSLAGKPKIFFVQACRGDKLDPGVTLVSRKGSVSETDTGTAAYKIPSHSDFLIAYSSMHGFYSWRNPEDGTWFIQSVVEELKKNAKHMNFLSLMTRVNRRVAVHYSSNNEDVPWLHDQKQVPTFHSTLIRDLVMRPKAA